MPLLHRQAGEDVGPGLVFKVILIRGVAGPVIRRDPEVFLGVQSASFEGQTVVDLASSWPRANALVRRDAVLGIGRRLHSRRGASPVLC